MNSTFSIACPAPREPRKLHYQTKSSLSKSQRHNYMETPASLHSDRVDPCTDASPPTKSHLHDTYFIHANASFIDHSSPLSESSQPWAESTRIDAKPSRITDRFNDAFCEPPEVLFKVEHRPKVTCAVLKPRSHLHDTYVIDADAPVIDHSSSLSEATQPWAESTHIDAKPSRSKDLFNHAFSIPAKGRGRTVTNRKNLKMRSKGFDAGCQQC